MKIIISFIAGSFILSLLSIIQKKYSGYNILPKSFIVPILYGGLSSAVIYYLFNKQYQKHIQNKEQKYRKLVNNINSGVAIYKSVDNGKDFILLDINAKGQKINNINPDNIIGKSFDCIYDSKDLYKALNRVYRTGNPENYPIKHYKNGELKNYLTNYIYKLSNSEIVIIFEDLTEKIKVKEKLRKTKKRLEMAIEGAELGIWDWNIKTGRVKYNKNWANMLGYKSDELDNRVESWNELIHKDDRDKVFAILNNHLKGNISFYKSDHRLKTKEGKYKWIHDAGKVVKWDKKGNPLRIVGIHQDIDNRKKTEEKIKYISFHDGLTGLYNRRYFENEIERLNKSRNLPISIIVGDLDGLKYINDNYGHKMGDRYIKKAAKSIKSNTRTADVVARIGGDEFAIILPETNASAAKDLCERIHSKCNLLKKTCNLPKPLNISLGFATKVKKEESLDDIFEKADKRMYKNKKTT